MTLYPSYWEIFCGTALRPVGCGAWWVGGFGQHGGWVGGFGPNKDRHQFADRGKKIRTSPNLSILHRLLKPSLKRKRMRRHRAIFFILHEITFYQVCPGLCDTVPVPVWVPGWQSRCQRPTKDGLLLPKGAMEPGSASFRCGHKSDNPSGWHASPLPILLLTVEDSLLLLLLLVETVWLCLLPPRHLDATGCLRFIQYCP